MSASDGMKPRQHSRCYTARQRAPFSLWEPQPARLLRMRGDFSDLEIAHMELGRRPGTIDRRFTNKLDRECSVNGCGHRLGDHYPAGDQPCTIEGCTCIGFKETRKPSPRPVACSEVTARRGASVPSSSQQKRNGKQRRVV